MIVRNCLIVVALLMAAACTQGQPVRDTKLQMTEMWRGYGWDPSAWNENWRTDVTLSRFFENGVFHRARMDGGTPVLEVGPKFYALSELDQGRTVRLLIDHTGVFETGARLVSLRDWKTRGEVGAYTPDGLVMR